MTIQKIREHIDLICSFEIEDYVEDELRNILDLLYQLEARQRRSDKLVEALKEIAEITTDRGFEMGLDRMIAKGALAEWEDGNGKDID